MRLSQKWKFPKFLHITFTIINLNKIIKQLKSLSPLKENHISRKIKRFKIEKGPLAPRILNRKNYQRIKSRLLVKNIVKSSLSALILLNLIMLTACARIAITLEAVQSQPQPAFTKSAHFMPKECARIAILAFITKIREI